MFIRKIIIFGLFSVLINHNVCLGMRGVTRVMRRWNGNFSASKISPQKPISSQNHSRKILRNFAVAGGAAAAAYGTLHHYETTGPDDQFVQCIDACIGGIIKVEEKTAKIFKGSFARYFAKVVAVGDLGNVLNYIDTFPNYFNSEVVLAGLVSALVYEKKEIANLLLQKYAKTVCGEAGNRFLALGLRHAVKSHQEELVKFLLAKGANPEHEFAYTTPIILSHDRLKLSSVHVQISPHLPYYIKSYYGIELEFILIRFALEKKDFKIARLLLEHMTRHKDFYRKQLEEAEAAFKEHQREMRDDAGH